MLPVQGKPILHHIINKASADGFKNIVISINYLGQQIVDYFGDGSAYNVNIQYIQEKEPMGTAGALSLLANNITNDMVVVTMVTF